MSSLTVDEYMANIIVSLQIELEFVGDESTVDTTVSLLYI